MFGVCFCSLIKHSSKDEQANKDSMILLIEKTQIKHSEDIGGMGRRRRGKGGRNRGYFRRYCLSTQLIQVRNIKLIPHKLHKLHNMSCK